MVFVGGGNFARPVSKFYIIYIKWILFLLSLRILSFMFGLIFNKEN